MWGTEHSQSQTARHCHRRRTSDRKKHLCAPSAVPRRARRREARARVTNPRIHVRVSQTPQTRSVSESGSDQCVGAPLCALSVNCATRAAARGAGAGRGPARAQRHGPTNPSVRRTSPGTYGLRATRRPFHSFMRYKNLLASDSSSYVVTARDYLIRITAGFARARESCDVHDPSPLLLCARRSANVITLQPTCRRHCARTPAPR